ncbi:hypothetical protein BKP45_14695 [Anaerobacillus alkalidiazotrophicus]|uniref:DUF1990 domain-containing protein n=1 Tax=Anaerobacillus alkalidiazotrophicus TaxID=472963 RepID=A0A1S2M2K8_9BACI|nr:hypothetical protein [Anaerobacillus alkalidiazotrophicus]OIJ18971.1 hypothetical protein BKP45_14695 [Anaerobacillus alkalidiazotrophicus]
MTQKINHHLKQYLDVLKSNYHVKIKKNGLVAFNNDSKRYWSIQILNIHNRKKPSYMVGSYFQWLATESKNIISVSFQDKSYSLYVKFLKTPVLILTIQTTTNQKVVLHVTGGLLAKKNQIGTFTFLMTEKGERFIVALERFEPSLPWWVYRITQAPIHEFVMKRFQMKNV